MAVRREIVERREQGRTLQQIASDLGLSYYTVRGLWRRYCKQGLEGLDHSYHRCGRQKTSYPAKVEQVAQNLKNVHPEWSARQIRLHLLGTCPESNVPTERTLQRWLRASADGRSL